MLNLSVSSFPCAPGRKLDDDQGVRPKGCYTCGAPGGASGELLEPHIVGSTALQGGETGWLKKANTSAARRRVRYLCPLCHMCLHLDRAGALGAGRVVWLPEFTQEQLNILCLGGFVASVSKGIVRKEPDSKALLDQIARLYRNFEKRAEAVEVFLAGNGPRSPVARKTLSSPTFIASLLVRAQRDTKLSPKELALRTAGLRLLPNPKAFEKYIMSVARLAASGGGVAAWMPSVKAYLDAEEASRAAAEEAEREDAEHFDVADMEAEAGAAGEGSPPPGDGEQVEAQADRVPS